MRDRRGTILFSVALVLVTGCAKPASREPAPPETGDPAAWADRALADGAGHDHAKREHHANLSTTNFEVLGYDPLISPASGTTGGGHLCGDAKATTDGRRIAAVESRLEGGFEIIDVTDPKRPMWIGELVMPTTRVYDVAVVPDGRHVAVVTTSMTIPQPRTTEAASGSLVWRTPCRDGPVVLAPEGTDVVPRPSSLLLVDIVDPREPKVIDQIPLPSDGHSVFSTLVDGTIWVLATTILQSSYYYTFYHVVSTPDGGHLRLVATYRASGAGLAVSGGHDGWLGRHPVTRETLAYVTAGEEVHVLRFAATGVPEKIGAWSSRPANGSAVGEFQHSVFPLPDVWDGRHYTIVGPEFGKKPQGKPSGTVWVLDDTDPTRPVEVAAWTLPYEVVWSGEYMFSNHYFTVVNRTLFETMYHGGVWAIDLSPVRPGAFVSLPSIGVFLPDRVSPKPPASQFRWSPTVEDVLSFDDGTLVTFDGASGVYTLRFDATRPAPAPEPWPLHALH